MDIGRKTSSCCQERRSREDRAPSSRFCPMKKTFARSLRRSGGCGSTPTRWSSAFTPTSRAITATFPRTACGRWRAIDAGADVVFAHGPHRLRGIEAYGRGVVLYGLGNFAFESTVVHPQARDPFEAGADLYERLLGGVTDVEVGRRTHSRRRRPSGGRACCVCPTRRTRSAFSRAWPGCRHRWGPSCALRAAQRRSSPSSEMVGQRAADASTKRTTSHARSSAGDFPCPTAWSIRRGHVGTIIGTLRRYTAYSGCASIRSLSSN